MISFLRQGLWLTLALLLLAPGTHAAKSDEDTAEEVAPKVGEGQPTRRLAERIPAVTRRAFAKRHRVELYPVLGLSLTDPFYRYVMPGLGLNYYVLETLALGISADYYGGVQTSIPVAGATVRPEPVFNKPTLAARLQVSWVPLYGKISWLAERVMHFDTYGTLSGGAIIPQSGSTALAFSAALGQHYFINEWLAVRLEVRDEFYTMARQPKVSATKALQSLLSASLGVCFYLPQQGEPED